MWTRRPIALIALVLALLACSFLSPTPLAPQPQAPQPLAPTALAPAGAPPTAAVEPTATEVPPTATPETQQFFTEQFDSGMDNWTTYWVDGNNGVISDSSLPSTDVSVQGGSLVFDLANTYTWAYSMYEPFDYTDVKVEASFSNQGTNNNNISLVCRYVKDKGWYEFNVANNGLYWIYNAEPRADGYVRYLALGEGGSNTIKQGIAVNEYAITCQGTKLSLYINGKLTKSVTATARSTGKVGVSVSSFVHLPVKVSIDWVKISQP